MNYIIYRGFEMVPWCGRRCCGYSDREGRVVKCSNGVYPKIVICSECVMAVDYLHCERWIGSGDDGKGDEW